MGSVPAFPQSSHDHEVILENPPGVGGEPVQPPAAGPTSRFQISPIGDERPANLVFESRTDGRRHHHEGGGTYSPSPEGSTYTTASESGGPVTIDSEAGNYVSASEDHPINKVPSNIVVPTSIEMNYAIGPPHGGAAAGQPQQPQLVSYPQAQALNASASADVTIVPQLDNGLVRVSFHESSP